MNEAVKTVLLLSAVGGSLSALLLCIKPLTKRLFSPKWQYYIWLIVLVSMVFPLKLSLPTEPLQNITQTQSQTVQNQQISTAEVQKATSPPAVLSQSSQKPALKTPNIPKNIVNAFGFLWLSVAIVLFVYRIIKYMLFIREIKRLSVCENNLDNIPKRLKVRKTEVLDAPLIVGLIKPVLYLPKADVSKNQLDYILLHELTHYKRHDLLYKCFAMLVLSIHWFNPFAYIMSRQIDEECEISCDLEVCKNFNNQQKKEYMSTILNFVQLSIKKTSLITQMSNNKEVLKRRFNMIKNKKPVHKIISAISLLTAFAMLSSTELANNIVFSDISTIKILNKDGKEISFSNYQPFMKNNCIYVPPEETIKNSDFGGKIDIKYNSENKTAKITLLLNNNTGAVYDLKADIPEMKLQRVYIDKTGNIKNDGICTTIEYFNGDCPIIDGSKMYVPIRYADYILHGFLNIRDENNKLCELTYEI